MPIRGYGEDGLTLLALQQGLNTILQELRDDSAANECTAFYRPSFGRGGDASFGEFDVILVSASDIYLIPMTVQGSRVVTHMEYFNLGNPQAIEAVAAMDASGVKFTNNGAWMWTNARTNGCIKTQGLIKPRLILRTPMLAGRITNVRVNPLQHERTPFPGDDTYFVNGGDTSESNWPL